MAGYNFANRADIDAVLAMVRDGTQRKLKPSVGVEIPPKLTQLVICYTPSGGIAARSTTTPGSAECTPYYIDSGGDLAELTDRTGDSQTFTVYHLGSTAIAGSTYIIAAYVLNKLVAVMEDCG